MDKGRLEAFSDGVLAIIITIMVLELKAPREPTLEALRPIVPVFLSYLLSFVFVAIYWNNHHHLLQAADHVTGRVLWANMHLLFWLSLVPVVTHWMGDTGFAAVPVAAYGAVMVLAGCAYYLLTRALVADHCADSALVRAVGQDRKGQLSVLISAAPGGLAFVAPGIACAGYVIGAIVWLVPAGGIERAAPARDCPPPPSCPGPAG